MEVWKKGAEYGSLPQREWRIYWTGWGYSLSGGVELGLVEARASSMSVICKKLDTLTDYEMVPVIKRSRHLQSSLFNFRAFQPMRILHLRLLQVASFFKHSPTQPLTTPLRSLQSIWGFWGSFNWACPAPIS